MPSQTDVQRWLDEGVVIAEPNFEQRVALDGLVGSAGFLAFLGLMLGEKQGLLLQLARMPLSTEAGRYQAAVLQGRILAIDALPQTVLDLFPPATGRTEEQTRG